MYEYLYHWPHTCILVVIIQQTTFEINGISWAGLNELYFTPFFHCRIQWYMPKCH